METYYKGLSEEEAKKRLKEYGLNEIPQKRENIYLNLLKRFISPVNILLEITILLTFLIDRYYDSAIISFLLLFNIFISFLHEKKAKDALEILKKKVEINANVLRDGKWQEIPAKYLTVGDIVSLRQGDIIPADCKILSGSLSVDESVITGESLPKDVKENDEIYMGAIVSRGNGICEVIRVGKNSFYGKSAQLLKLAKKKGILEEVVFKLVSYMFILSTIVVIFLFYP